MAFCAAAVRVSNPPSFRKYPLYATQAVKESRSRFGSNDIVAAPPSGCDLVSRSDRIVFAWLGDYVEAAILAIALAPIVGMDAYLHRRTQARTEGVAGRFAVQAHVLRDGVLGVPCDNDERVNVVFSPTCNEIAETGGPWDVTFQAERGPRASARLQKLQSLNGRADLGIRYFSGIAMIGAAGQPRSDTHIVI